MNSSSYAASVLGGRISHLTRRGWAVGYAQIEHVTNRAGGQAAQHVSCQLLREMGTETTAGDAPEVLANTSVFPPPPSMYKLFSKQNMAWLAVLRKYKGEADWTHLDAEARLEAQRTVLQRAVEGIDALTDHIPMNLDLERELLPPRVDWIEEDGGYQLFGQRWPIPDIAPSLDQLGIPRYFPEGPFDRKDVLKKLLRTILQTYFELVCDLLQPIRPYDIPVPAAEAHSEAQTTWIPSSHLKERIQHMETVVINFQYLLNELRPAQTRTELSALLRSQLSERRRATQHIRAKCKSIRDEIPHLDM